MAKTAFTSIHTFIYTVLSVSLYFLILIEVIREEFIFRSPRNKLYSLSFRYLKELKRKMYLHKALPDRVSLR